MPTVKTETRPGVTAHPAALQGTIRKRSDFKEGREAGYLGTQLSQAQTPGPGCRPSAVLQGARRGSTSSRPTRALTAAGPHRLRHRAGRGASAAWRREKPEREALSRKAIRQVQGIPPPNVCTERHSD